MFNFNHGLKRKFQAAGLGLAAAGIVTIFTQRSVIREQQRELAVQKAEIKAQTEAAARAHQSLRDQTAYLRTEQVDAASCHERLEKQVRKTELAQEAVRQVSILAAQAWAEKIIVQQSCKGGGEDGGEAGNTPPSAAAPMNGIKPLPM